jgi:predicted  nucleic acid-binding Zn-ribbon protein
MLPDLDRMIQLQRLDNTAAAARLTANTIPVRIETLNTHLKTSTATVDASKSSLADEKNRRQGVEKKLAEVQGRLSRFKEQLMAVKTNKEYTAVQHEISTAEREVQRLEDTILEHMLALDELSETVVMADRTHKAYQTEINGERDELEAERSELDRQLQETAEQRSLMVADIGTRARALFELIAAKRQGVAIVEARDGLCTLCNVRLRPQMFNDIRTNTELIQCESCNRILYHDPNNTANAEAPADELTS